MVDYITGDATKPIGGGNKIIAHVCNDSGGWGAGFVLSLNQMSTIPMNAYTDWYRNITGEHLYLPLGINQYVAIPGQRIWVANMIAMHGVGSKLNPHPLSYDALEHCLDDLADEAIYRKASVHMPRIGAGLAGGDWNVIESMIDRNLTLNDIEVEVYDLP